MYSKSVINRINKNESRQTPEPLSTTLVSSGVVIGSISELPIVGVQPPAGFYVVGDPVKVARQESVRPNGCISLSKLRLWLAERFEANPNACFGIANKGQDWAHVQEYGVDPA